MADNTQTASVNYSDIFCQAVENIVNGVTSKLKYDISKECTIIKINNKAQNKYQLSDGSITFEAIANGNVSYDVGDRVMVTIPAGDYNKQISILTKIIGDTDSPAGWVRPMDTLIRCTPNLCSRQKHCELVANGIIKDKEILTLSSQSYQGFRKLGLSAEFMTRLDNFSVVKGTYGIKIIINPQTDALECDLSNMDMFGNPYNFITYFSQEAVFEIPETIETISDIIVYFYQNKDFQDAYGDIVHNDNISTLFVKNIEIYLGYDSTDAPEEIVTINSPTLSYTSPGDLQHNVTLTWYHTVENNQMNMITQSDLDTKEYAVRWYQYSPGCKEEEKDTYGGDNWRIVNRTMKNDKEVINSSIVQHFTMRGTRTIERIKAICFIATHPLINDPSYTVWEQYHSNELKFENKTEDTSGGEDTQEVLKKNLSLKFDDESYGNYYFYDQNNELLDSKESSIERHLHLCYDGVYIEDTTTPLNITKVIWTYPQTKTMLKVLELNSDTINYEIGYTIKQRVYPEYTNNIISCSVYAEDRLITTLSEVLRFGQKGTSGTGNTFLLEMVNNDAVIIGGQEELIVEAMLIRDSGKRFYFSEEDAKGITWTLFYADEDFRLNNQEPNDNSITISEHTSPRVTLKYLGDSVPTNNYAILKASYKPDANGPELIRYLPIPLQRSTKFIGFSHGATQVLYNHQGTPKYSNDAYELQYSNAKVANLNKDHKPTDRYWELQETLTSLEKGDRMAITFNGMVKIGDSDDDTNIPCFYLNINKKVYGVRYEGSIKDEIFNLSNPTFYVEYTPDTKYTATDQSVYETFKIIPQTLVLNQSNDNPNPVTLKLVRGEGQCLSAALLYSKKSNSNAVVQDKVCVSYKLGNTVVWSQPILIMQTPYDFAMLNEWDGSLTIDEENGIILATMLGAGKKNTDNTFSGVLIGDIKDGTDLDDADCMTGVYGFDHGVMSYGLKENGSAFFGAAANGRIEINGSHGAIHSYGWTPEYKTNYTKWTLDKATKGSIFDLDDGQLQLYANANNYLKYNDNNSGKLEMALFGANIKLTDKTNNPSLSGYIDVTAKGLVTEFRRTASYYATCSTESSWTKSGSSWSENTNNQTKVLTLKNFNVGYKTDSKTTDDEVKIEHLTTDDIFKEGIIIAVTFTQAENVKVVTAENTTKVDGENKVTGYTDQRIGHELELSIDNKAKPIYINNRITSNTNPYGWAAGSTIYFTYKKKTETEGYWEVSDSGSYSKITQTSDMIKTEVSNIAGTLGSSITQTADKIRLEVAQQANYACRCITGAGEEVKYIRFTENDYNKLKNLNDDIRSLSKGAILNITFEYANTSNTTKFQLCKDSNPVDPFMGEIPLSLNVKWEAGETLPFIFDGEKFTMTSISNSAITQTANSITSEVRRTAGYGCTASNPTSGNSGYIWTLSQIQPNPNDSESINDIYHDGVTLAITFNAASQTPTTATSTYLKDSSGNKTRPVYIKNAQAKVIQSSNITSSNKNQVISWSAYDTIFVTYDSSLDSNQGGWRIVDSGAYSKITQTADAIKLEVGKTANYSGSCPRSVASETAKVVEGLPTSLTSIDKGCTLLVNFTNASHSDPNNADKNQKKLSINNVLYNIKLGTYWEAGETVGFIYNGSQFVMTTLSNSTITQLNNSIDAKVSATGGNGGTFAWSLKPNGFYLSNSSDATVNPVFKCDANGITIGGKGVIQSANYSEGSSEGNSGNIAATAGMKIDLTKGQIIAKDFTLSSNTVQISPNAIKVGLLFNVSNDTAYIKTSNYKRDSSGEGGPGYYYVTATCNHSYMHVRDFSTGIELKDTNNQYLYLNTGDTCVLESNSSGKPLEEQVPGKFFNGYKVHFTRNGVQYAGYVSVKVNGYNTFKDISTTVGGGPSTKYDYKGSGLELNDGILVLTNNRGQVIIGGPEAPIVIRNLAGDQSTSIGSYI